MTEATALGDVAIFLAVTECESFVGAARRLGMPQSSVSRRVAALERLVGTPLIRRTTRSLSLTLEGQRLTEACTSPVAQVRTALEDIASTASGAKETLSIAISPYICPEQFRAWVADFCSERPDLQIDLTTSSKNADYVADGVDLAIQFEPPKQRSLVSVKLYDVPFYLVASHEMLRQKPELGRLKDPDDLLAHDCAILRPITTWRFVSPDGEERHVTPTKLAAVSNDPWIAANAVRQGRGVGFVPEALMDDRLVPLGIAGWTPVASSVHAVFPQRLRGSHKVRSALESVRRRGSSTRAKVPARPSPRPSAPPL